MSQITREELLDASSAGGLRGANLVRADLSEMDMARVDLAEANLRMADLSRTDLTEARLSGCFLSGASLCNATMVGANLVEASIIGATLERADLSRADLSGADLTGANLKGARLVAAYLVGTFLNETDLGGADLSDAFVRMSQMSGSNLAGASLERADLSHARLSGVRLDGCCLANASLIGTNLSASVLTGCDLRGADLSGADLSGCNLTGAKLGGIQFNGAKLDDAWADWVDLSDEDGVEERGSLEEAFVGMVGKPMAQLLVEGHVGDEVWAIVLAHLGEFRAMRPQHSHVRLKAIHQGASSSAFYLEADQELSLAAYLADFADILGNGSLELFDKLASVIVQTQQADMDGGVALSDAAANIQPDAADAEPVTGRPPAPARESRTEILERTAFWNREKAIAILSGNRQVWLEAVSSPSLTLRPPHGAALGIDLIDGRFVTEEGRLHRSRKRQQ